MDRTSKNGYRLMRSLFRIENQTRLSLSKSQDLSLLNVSSILGELESQAYVRKSGKLQAKTGRPSFTYQLEPDSFHTIGLSVETGSIGVAAIDASKRILHKTRVPLEARNDARENVDLILGRSAELARSAAETMRRDNKAPCAVGVSLAGMVDSLRGVWLLGLHVGGVRDEKIAARLQELIQLPVYIEDESRSLAFHEKVCGRGTDVSDFICLYLGSGVGSGIVINDEIYRGTDGVAGEIGHTPHGHNQYRCSCGNVGCLEAVVSKSGIIRVINDRLEEGVVSTLSTYLKQGACELDLDLIKKAAEEGDRFVLATLFELGEFIGDACDTLIKLFNPQRIIISGQGAILGEFFREAIQQKIRHSIILSAHSNFDVVFADYSPESEAYAAALVAFDRHLAHLIEA